MAGSTITIRRYYASFKSVWGVLASIFGVVLPIFSGFLSGSANASTFPPLGDFEPFARAALVIFAFFVTFAVYFWADNLYHKTGRIMAIAIALGIISLLGYFALYERFVRSVDIPSRGSTVYVSVGYERTAFASATFDSLSDENLLRARGTDEEQLRILWTTKSLIVARVILYAAYSLIVLVLVGAFSCGVVRNIYENTPS